MSLKFHSAALENTSEQLSAAAKANRAERRSLTRPRFVESWRKVIEPDWKREPCNDGRNLGEKLRVAVWVARTKSLLNAHSSHKILTVDDRSAHSRLQTRATRDCAIAAKLLLRLCLSQTVQRRIEPCEWHFQRTLLGKPRISSYLPNINFSVSHADAVTVVAVSSSLNLGIDVESVDQELTGNVIAGFCSPKEQTLLQGLPRSQRAREFIRLWTQKEAYTKLLGCGHSIEFSSIECLPDTLQEGTEANTSIHFESFYVPVDQSLFHASLAIEKSNDASVDIRLINVLGPAGKNPASPIPIMN